MGLLLDIVPNHMCIAGDDNRRWLDVLENGPSSPRRPLLRHRLAAAQARAGRAGCCCRCCPSSTASALERGPAGGVRGGALLHPLQRHPPAAGPRAPGPTCWSRRWPHLRRRFGDEQPRRAGAGEHPARARPPARAAPTPSRPGCASACTSGRSSAAGWTRCWRAAPRCAARRSRSAARDQRPAGRSRAASIGWRRCWPPRATA